MVFLLAARVGFSQASDNQPRSCVGCFSEPQSTLLYRGSCEDLRLITVTPRGIFTVPMPANWVGQCASPIPTINPSGNRIAWSLQFRYDTESVKCDPLKKGWCDPHPRPIFKSALGVYSVLDKAWKQYGNFETVGSAAFSPDGNKVAFISDYGLTVLDLETGQMTRVPSPASRSVFWIGALSWSPDGKYLADDVAGHRYGDIVVIDVATGETKTIAEGSDASWSPKGDWIAYIKAADCMIIHPDGTGARSLFEEERKWMEWGPDPPLVWAPDGERLLINQRKADAAGSRIIMMNLATGHGVRISKNPEVVVSGWVPYTGN